MNFQYYLDMTSDAAFIVALIVGLFILRKIMQFLRGIFVNSQASRALQAQILKALKERS